MKHSADNKQLRSFGLLVGGVFALIGVWPMVFRGMPPRPWALILAALLIAPALIFPRALTLPHRGWMALSEILGWVNTRIILGVIFYILLTPIGVIRRLLGKDPMGRQLRPELDSYRVLRKPRPGSHMTRQY